MVTQYGLAVAGGYWPAKYRGARAEWTLFVGGRELGSGTMSESGILSTTVFTEAEIELWGEDASGGSEGVSGGNESTSGDEGASGNGEGKEHGEENNLPQTQVQVVSLPEQSAAYAWFVTFPGTPTDLVVTTLNEQAEIYSFKLVSLDSSDAETLLAALTSGGGFDQESAGGRHDICVQKEFGEKHFTISVALTGDGNGYKAEVLVTGFVDEE